MSIPTERTVRAYTIGSEEVQVEQHRDRLYLNAHAVLHIAANLDGTVQITTTSATLQQTHKHLFRDATFWDILYDTPPTKEYAGQIEALMLSFHQTASLLVQLHQERKKLQE
jgi:hypothetical protein